MADETYLFGSFQLVPAQRLLLNNGRSLRLGSRALEVLIALAECAGDTVSKDELIGRVWPDTVVDEGALRVHVAAVRKALGDGREGNRFIASIPGRGYSFVAPVTREQRQEVPAPPPNQPAHSGNLPALLTRVVGRDEVIAAVVSRCSQHRLLTIVGPGGIGKTTVAIAAAEQMSASFADGSWFIGLATLVDAALVAGAVGAALGMPSSGVDPLRALAAWSRDKHMLIVLDCCEHVIGTAAAIAEAVLRTAPRVCILATSREPLRAESEWLLRLPSLEVPSGPAPLSADEALGYSAVQLFNERAVAAIDGFVLSDADIPKVLEICRGLDGMPLALELAAVQVDVFGVQGLAEGLTHRFDLLTRGRRTALPRQQTLRATIDWSYDLLPEVEKVVLRRLAAFRGGFTMEAAGSVVGDEHIRSFEVIEIIANLSQKSLVATDISGDITYYYLLDTTRAYALEKLNESGEATAISRRHADYYEHLLTAVALNDTAANEFADCAREIDNIRAALTWAFSQDGDPALGFNLIAASAPLWFRLSLNSEYRRRVERALRLLSDLSEQDSLVEMRLQIALGHALWYTQSDAELLQQAFARALELADRIGEAPDRLRLQALWGMWAARRGRGQYREALALAIRYEAVARSVGDPAFVLLADRILGLSHHFLGNQGLARQHTEQVRRVARGSENPPNTEFQLSPEVAAASLLTRILWLQGFPDQALAMLGEAIDAAQRSGHRFSMSYVLTFAGCPASVWTGNLSETQKYINMITDLDPGNVTIDHLTRWWSLVLRLRQGDERDVLIASYIEPRLDLSTFSEIVVLGSGSTITMPSPNDEVGDALWSLPEVLRVNAELLLWRDAPGAAEAAEAELLRSIDWARQHSALSWELRAATSLARLQRDLGRTREARDLLASVYGRFTEGFGTADLKEAKALLGKLTEPAIAAEG